MIGHLLRIMLWLGMVRAAQPATAFDHAAFTVQVLRHSGDWDSRNAAWKSLLVEVERQTSVTVNPEPVPVDPGTKDLFRVPVLSLSGSTAFQPFSDTQVENLSRWLRAGGLLFIENTQGALGQGFDRSARELTARLFPGKPLQPVGRDHVIHQSFFLLDYLPGRMIYKPDLEGIWLDDRTPILYSRNDISGAWMRDDLGSWHYSISPGGETQRDACFRFGINLVMYALTVNYKKDQVHIPFILQRRR